MGPYRYTFQLTSFDEKIKKWKVILVNYEIILYYFQIVLKISLDSDSGVFSTRIDLWPDPGSMNTDTKNVPLHIATIVFINIFIKIGRSIFDRLGAFEIPPDSRLIILSPFVSKV